jgi:hypothetical protein
MPYVKINGPGSHILVQCETGFASFKESSLDLMVCHINVSGPEGGSKQMCTFKNC